VLQNIPAERMTGGEVEQALLAIQNASDRGRDMLTQLGAGQVFQKPELQPVALAQIIHDAVRLITPQARSQGIAITTDIDASFWVEVDITQISRVVMNLLSNALRAIGQNGQIDVVTQADQNGITLVVQDNGCGMNSEQLAKAFDPGFSTKGQGQGGLGLAISYLIIEAHGGRLSLSSEKGRGTIAKIWLPLWHGQNQGHYDVKTKPSPSFASENILLLLNQNDLRQRLAEHFGACGSEVAELAKTQELAAVLLEAPEYWTILIRGKDIALDPALWHQCRYLSDIVLDQSGKSPPRIRLNANSNISAEEILAELRTA
jgi:two-component sensor histidine kinase